MSLPQFFVSFDVSDPPSEGDFFTLSAEDAHHAQHVLRLPAGSEVRLILLERHEGFLGTLAYSDAEAQVRITSPLPAITDKTSTSPALLFGLCKGKKTDLVIEKATELGVEEIFIWQTTRSVVSIRSEQEKEKKRDRWKNIALAAAKQCKRMSLPRIELLCSLKELENVVSRFSGEKLLCSLSDESTLLSAKDFQTPSAPLLAIGPEGDFTPQEEEFLAKHGFRLVSLGENILRSETAALTAVAMTRALLR